MLAHMMIGFLSFVVLHTLTQASTHHIDFEIHSEITEESNHNHENQTSCCSGCGLCALESAYEFNQSDNQWVQTENFILVKSTLRILSGEKFSILRPPDFMS